MSNSLCHKSNKLTSVVARVKRLDEDFGVIDGELPEAFELTLYAILSFLGESILIFIGSSYLVVMAIPVVFVIIVFLGRFYVRTVRQIRLLDSQAKAHLRSHCDDLMSGIVTIRAYGWLETYRCQGAAALEFSQRTRYTFECIQRWLSITLDLTVAGIATFVVTVALFVKGGQHSNMLGIALFNLVGFSGTLHVLIKQWTSLDKNIGAISRICTVVRDLNPEDLVTESKNIPSLWPERGLIYMNGVTASYE